MEDAESRDLLGRIARKDEAALSEFYDACGRGIYSMAVRMLFNEKEAEEVVQDVFVTVWRKAGTFDGARAKPFTWLAVLTRNKCIDRIRARGRRIPAAEALSGEAMDNGGKEMAATKSAAGDLQARERASALQEAVAQLPPEQRKAIDLAFFSGLTHGEIAETLGISLGTAKSRIRYGLEKLRASVPANS